MWYRRISFDIPDDDFVPLMLALIHSREHFREQYCFYVDFNAVWAKQCLEESAVTERIRCLLKDNSKLVLRDESD